MDGVKKRRTPAQNRSLHLYLTLLSEALNDSGYDIKRVLSGNEVEIPWTPESAKELLWRQIQVVMFGVESTAKLNSAQCTRVHEVLSRHLSSKFGIFVPWPSVDRESI